MLMQSGLLNIFRPNFGEAHHSFAGIETQTEQSPSKLYVFKLLLQLA